MLLAALVLALGQCGPDGPVYSCASSTGNRAPFFALGATNNGGMGPECSGLRPYDPQQVLSFSRPSAATCCKADGYCVDLASGEPAISVCPKCSSGPYGLTSERAGTNTLLRSYQLDNASWTVVGAGVVAANSFDSAFAACVATGRCTGGADRGLEQLNDDQAGSSEGVSQAVAITTAAKYALSCWLRSGTATSARLVIAGTGSAAGDRTCTFTGLTNTPTRYACISTASYAGTLTAITSSVLVGSVVGDTGTIGAGDCQLEVDNYWDPHVPVSSYIPTTTVAVTRSRTVTTLVGLSTTLADSSGCAGVSYFRRQWDAENPEPVTGVANGTHAIVRSLAGVTTNSVQALDGVTVVTSVGGSSGVYNTLNRMSATWGGAGLTAVTPDLVRTTGVFDGTIRNGGGNFVIGDDSSAGANMTDSWMTGVVLSTNAGACRSMPAVGPGNRVAWVGDSLSTYNPNPPPTVLASLEGVAVDNFAELSAQFIAGTTPRNCRLQWTTFGRGAHATLVIACGVNDILSAVSGATLWASYQSFIEDWIARGVDVVPVTIGPFKNYSGWTAPLEVEKDAFNTSLMAWCAANAGTKCVDTRNASNAALNPGLANPGDLDALDPAFDFGDGLHYSPAGNTRLGTLVSTQGFPSCSKAIGCGITAGDKAGNWWVLQSDGTMESGSALTLAAQGSPGVSPITLNGTTQYFSSSNVAYPTGDFSFVCGLRADVSNVTGELIAKWDNVTLATTVEFTGSGGPRFYVNGTSTLGATAGSAFAAPRIGAWVAIAGSYTSSSGAIVLRQAGVNATATATGGGVVVSTQAHSVGAKSNGGSPMGIRTRGCFFTEKVLSNADMDRIMAGVL